MRMRRLGSGQSVVFCVPEEIRTKILKNKNDTSETRIAVADILKWAISETNQDLRRTMPIWATQGRTFQKHQTFWEEAGVNGILRMDHDFALNFMEEEAQDLESRYRPQPSLDASRDFSEHASLNAITQRCREFDVKQSTCVNFQEGQERVLAPENEREREVERPAPAKSADHNLHVNVERFVETGEIPADEDGFLFAFESLGHTTAAQQLNFSQFPRSLRVTQDFANTVQMNLSEDGYDSYQRGVEFVLTAQPDVKGASDFKMVIISPFEANVLYEKIESSTAVRKHVYLPRQNLAYSPLDHLNLFTTPEPTSPQNWPIPRKLIIELNLFAGQLYFSSFKEYTEVCDFLGLAWSATEEGMLVRADGFIEPRARSRNRSIFTQSPVQFLKTLLIKIRRDCGAIEKSHMGKVLDGALLTEDDFEPRPKRKVEDDPDE